MISRTLGSLLRGSSAPIQLLLACVMGALIGFVPGAADHIPLVVVLALALVVLNANLGIALVVGGIAKLACLSLMPISFKVGRMLIDGDATRPFFAWAVDAPVLALMDLDVYAVSGGLALGLVIGVALGVVLVGFVGGLRRKFAGLEENSEKYKQLTSKTSVRFLVWLLLGSGHGKQTYGDMLGKRFGSPVRLVGVVILGLVAAGVWLAPALVGGELLASATRTGLETVHGATVDVGGVSLDIAGGHLAIEGLALADPEDLGHDLFRASRLEADGSMKDLLRGRLSLDRLVLVDGRHDVERDSPGELVGDARDASEPPPADDEPGMTDGTLEDWVAEAEMIEQRLRQVKEWLEKMAEGDDEAEPDVPADETLEERLEREVDQLGYGRVRAQGLRGEAPALLIRELLAEGIQAGSLGDELLDLTGSNLSSDPALVGEPARLTLKSRGDSVLVDLGLGGAGAALSDNVVRVAFHGISGDRIGALLGGDRLAGGTVDFDMDGSWSAGQVGHLDLPLNITLRDVLVDIVGGPRDVSELVLPFDIKGPIDNPRIKFKGDALQDALLSQAKAELDAKVAELEAKVDEKTAELEAKVDEKTAELETKLEEEQAEAEAEVQDEVDKAKDKLGGKLNDKLGGLFGGKDDG
jgi:uncharacterized protein (DUF2062 family)